MKIQAGSKLVMIGDSITDSSRARPVGEGRGGATGNGYVAMVEALLNSAHPAQSIRVVNQGLSGNTVRDLKARWKTDVLDLNPEWLSIMIGINDVWRQFDTPCQKEIHVLPDEYAALLDELVAGTRPKVKGLVLMTPFMIEPNKSDAMRVQMDRYSAVVRELAAKHDAVFVDTQAAFDEVLEHGHAMALAWDRIHPGPTGHMVIARAFLKSVGFVW